MRFIGSVTSLALLMVGCGGGGGGGDSGPPYTVGGTVSGLLGSGLTLAICTAAIQHGGNRYPDSCRLQLRIGANGAFTLDSAYPPGNSGRDYVATTQQPSSPTQTCVISNAAVRIQNANDTSVEAGCSDVSFLSFVTNAGDNTVSGYSVDATTGGTLQAIGTPTLTGTSPYAIVGAQISDKRYVFVGNEGSNDISAFAVDTTGALTAAPGSPFAAGTDPKAVVLYGGALYVANAGSDNLSVYAIDAVTGALAPLSPGSSTIATGKNPTSIVVDPDGSQIYVANHGGSNDISDFYSDLTPAAGSPFPGLLQ